MAFELVRKKTSPIGIDLGSRRVKMVQLRLGGDDAELLAAGAAEVQLDGVKGCQERTALLLQAVRGILRSNPVKGRHCILSLPAQETFVHHVKLPRLSPQQTQEALRMELGSKLPYPVEEAVIQHIVAGEVCAEGEARREVIVVAAPRATLEAYLAMARRAKLDVVGVNIEACAIVECFSRMFRRAEDSARTILFVDLGAASTQVVLSHGGHIVFARNLTSAGQQLDHAVADGMSISIEQAGARRRELQQASSPGRAEDELYRLLDRPLNALADEVTQCLRYYESVFRNQPIERVIFLGGQAHDKRLCQGLAQRLNLPAQVGDPLSLVKRVAGAATEIGIDRRQPQPDWAVAIGLCLGTGMAA